MQGLPFFSFSSQSAGPLTDGQPPASPLSSQESTGFTPYSSAQQSNNDLPEFMQRLLQAMTQDNAKMAMPQGQELAAEESTDPLLELSNNEGQGVPTLPLMQPSKMDMDSIQVQRDFQPNLTKVNMSDSEAAANLMARAQFNQVNTQDAAATNNLQAAPTAMIESANPIQPNANTATLQQTQSNIDVIQATVDSQAKLAPQGSSVLGNALKNVGVEEKSDSGNAKGSSESAKLTALMTPVNDTNPMVEKLISTEQLASMSTAGANELSGELGDAIDEMWQQSQTPNRQAAVKASSGPGQSFFEQIQAKLDLPPTDVRFGEQVSKRIGMMVSEQMQSARIQLDPPELGSLEIKVRVQQDQVNVSFASNNQAVRDALEAQAPRLREMLNQQGVDLGNLDVSSQGKQNQGGDGQPQDNPEHFLEDEMIAGSEALDNLEQQIRTIENDGSVDYFA